jgi:ABC-2 type transport system ATP-binding protein
VAVINKGQLLVVDSVNNIIQRGVEGYTVQLSLPDGATDECLVAKDDLHSFIEQTIAKNWSIERIEPKRKDMEAFFLDLVAAEQHHDTRS